MNGVIINVRGAFHVGKDRKIHTEDCCKIPHPWSREDKGFHNLMELVKVENWPLPVIPRVGESIKLPDGSEYDQEVTVEDIIYSVPRRDNASVDIWVGGWTHWEAQSVRDVFAYAREHVEKERQT